ncbi:MAG: hypothetical protein RIS29_1168 [Bacteroidota bacterium]|jgi:hypothetical protein
MKLIQTIVFSIALLLCSCSAKETHSPKIRYSGYRICVGHGDPIELHLDSVSSIDQLVQKLSVHNQLYDTYKRDLIGYNDLMFSIAVHGDSAIQPLLSFIHSSRSLKAQKAAVYTLHLIGVNCISSHDGFFENFPNLKARHALFQVLATEEKLQPLVMLMLSRSPLASDVPLFFDILQQSKSDCWAITCGLVRYKLKDIPVVQLLPEDFLDKKLSLKRKGMGVHPHLSLILKQMKLKYPNQILVEDTLLKNYSFESLLMHDDVNIDFIFSAKNVSVTDICQYCSFVSPFHLGSNFQYYYRAGKLYFCSPATTKKMWLHWWKSQPTAYIDSLRKNNQIIADFKQIF